MASPEEHSAANAAQNVAEVAAMSAAELARNIGEVSRNVAERAQEATQARQPAELHLDTRGGLGGLGASITRLTESLRNGGGFSEEAMQGFRDTDAGRNFQSVTSSIGETMQRVSESAKGISEALQQQMQDRAAAPDPAAPEQSGPEAMAR